MQVSNIINTYQTQGYNTKNSKSTTSKTQEELSDAFYQHFNKSNTNDDGTKVKLNIFTGELYNFSEIYNSTDDFKNDMASSKPKNLMEKLKLDSQSGGIIILGEIQQNLADYYHGLDIVASFDMSVNHSNSNLTNEQINSIDFGQFFIQMLEKFNKELEEVKSKGNPQLIKQYEQIVQGYSFFNDAYSDIKTKEDENKTLLQEVTKNTKSNPLESIQKNQTNEKPNFIDTLDKLRPNVFEEFGISKDDEITFRYIIDDGEISEKELRNLTYEQTSQLNKFYYENMSYVIDEVGIEKTPILGAFNSKSNSLLTAPDFTNNERFNRALYETVLESSHLDRHELSEMISQLQTNLLQIHNDKEIQADFLTGTYRGERDKFYALEKENFDIDYEQFILNTTNHYKQEASKDQKFEYIKENYIQRAEWFSILQNNYQNKPLDI